MRASLVVWVAATAVWVGSVCAEAPVDIPNQDLKWAVEDALNQPDPTPADMLELNELVCTDHSGYMELTGLEYAANLGRNRGNQLDRGKLELGNNGIWWIDALSGLYYLWYLDLNNNKISDLSPLANLTRLTVLNLHQNLIQDIGPLSGLTSLKILILYDDNLNGEFCDNQVVDISPLAGLTSLEELDLYNNRVVDISPLAGLTSLRKLDLRGNPLGIWAHQEDIPRIRANNPGIDLQADPPVVSQGGVFFVDDDGPGDPGPADPSRSDPHEDGTAAHPFDSIQEAIGFADEGATILVGPGTYHEAIDLQGKRIRLTGIDPNGTARFPVVVGVGGGPGVSFTHGEGPDCQFSGFVLMQGPAGGAIYCEGSSPTISNCLIVGNRSPQDRGSAVTCLYSRAALIRCTIADNVGGLGGAGVRLVGSDVAIVHSILSGNLPHEIVLGDNNSVARVLYSAIQGGWPGQGNIAEDPWFVARGCWESAGDGGILGPSDPKWVMGDYHLQSQAGRWDAAARIWVYDARTSPCVDGGDPNAPVGREPQPNGDIVNIGAYGGTTQASRSLPEGGDGTIAMLVHCSAGTRM